VRISDTLEFLTGSWTLQRTLTDHRTGVCGSFSGTATVRWTDAAEAQYLEQGTLDFGAHHGPAGRTLRLLPAAGGAVGVRFANGRPFFELNLATGHCAADHPCVEDMHEISFTVIDAGTVEERWRVRGPATDYDALTTWRRA
jgi:hypothetical protein